MVLETSWETPTGWVVVRDVLSIGPWHEEQERSPTHRRARPPTTRPITCSYAPSSACRARPRSTSTASRPSTTEASPRSGATPEPRLPRGRGEHRRAWRRGSGLSRTFGSAWRARARGRAPPARWGGRVRRPRAGPSTPLPRPTTRPTRWIIAHGAALAGVAAARQLPRPPLAPLPPAQRADAQGPLRTPRPAR